MAARQPNPGRAQFVDVAATRPEPSTGFGIAAKKPA
jgi:hypothetical protein